MDVDSFESKMYIYMYVYVYNCHVFNGTNRSFENEFSKGEKNAIGSKNRKNLLTSAKSRVILYIYIYICLSVCLYSLEKLAFPKVHPSQ